ncbi:MAG: hypothetical protein WCL17_05830 [Actinomycetota bacterium]
MTHNTDYLGQLRRDWLRTGHTPSAQRAFGLLRARWPELPLAGLEDLGDVVESLERRSGLTMLQKAEVLKALLVEARDPEVSRALLQTLLPGIISTCRQLKFGEGVVSDPSEMLGVAIASCAELIHDWAGQSRQYCAPDLLSALRGRLRRWMLKEKDAARSVQAAQSAGEPSTLPSGLLTRLETMANGPHERMVRLTYQRVFEGRSLRDLAKSDRSAPQALQIELQNFARRYLL